MGAIASQITSLTIVYSIVYSDADKKKKLRVTGLYVGNSAGTGEFPAQMASYAKNVSIWWRHHVTREKGCISLLISSVNTVENSHYCYSIADCQIASNLCTCHDSTDVVSCASFCCNYFASIVMRARQNSYRIWIAMKKTYCNVQRSGSGLYHAAKATELIQTLEVVVTPTTHGL